MTNPAHATSARAGPSVGAASGAAGNWLAPAAMAAGAAGLYLLLRKAREMDLRDRVVLITGGSRGLGLLLAREFARHGAKVAICARDTVELDRAVELLSRQGSDAMAIRCDVADRRQVEATVAQVLRAHGRIDVLVNNAGIIQVGPLDSMTQADFARALDVMFWGVLHAAMAVLPHMRSRGEGRIVNVTSIGGMVSVPHLLPYNCAKFAAVGLSQGLRSELQGSGIKVTTIVPGVMRIGSHLNAEFHGQAEKEYAWFASASSAPLLSISDRRAARQIVKATRRGESLRILGLPANILARLHGMFPGLTADIMCLIERFLPPADSATRGHASRGADVEARMRSQLLSRLTTLGQRAAQRNNELAR